MIRFLTAATAILVVAGLMVSCEKAGVPDGISDAVYDLVQRLYPNSVDEYLYNAEKVYHFDTWRGPDDLTYLYSAKGEQLAAFGGFTGHGDGRCSDFYESATFVRTVYSNGRWLK